MSKIAICADLHFGYADRLDDIVWAIRVINKYCEHNNIDTIICLGDSMHDRRSIDIDVYCALYDVLAEAKQVGLHWYTILGNHDCFLKHSWKINSAKPLSSVITVIDDVKLLKIDDRRFWCLGFIHLEASYMKVLNKINDMAEENDNLFTHIGVRGATLNTCFMLRDWNFVTFENTKFNRIYTGHFHVHQNVENKVWYPGSPIPFKHDEGDTPHGFLIFNTDTNTHEFVDIWKAGAKYIPGPAPPQFMTILYEQIPDLTPQDITGNIIRIVLSNDHTHDEKSQLKQSLIDNGAIKVNWLLPKIKPITPGFHNGIKLSSPGELFVRWITHDKPEELDKKLLIKLDMETRAEGDDRYNYEEIDE